MIDNNLNINFDEFPLGFHMGRTHLTLKKQLNNAFADAGHDVTVEQMGLLICLWKTEGISQKALVNNVKKVKSSITRLIDNMEKRNLVVRITDKEDKRNKLIYLTYKGKALREELEVIIQQVYKEAFNGISKEHLEICKNVLINMYSNMENEK